MHQVLFRIPIPIGNLFPGGIPIYGFGMMLFLAFVLCTWLAGRQAEKDGISRVHIQDMAIWMFVSGIIGARLCSVFLEGVPLWQFFRIWDGGLVFYGSAVGGLIGYILFYFFVVRKHGLSTWKIADVVAPSLAVGLCLGRIGCFLNGCCYGTVACGDACPRVHFPLSSPSRFTLVQEGYQTAAGFTLSEKPGAPQVAAVEPGSAAASSGLRPGDTIVAADNQPLQTYGDLQEYLTREWPRGKNDLSLKVQRGGQEVALPSFSPRTLGLHPTQLYESISMVLLFGLMMAYFPFRKHAGEVMAICMFGYGLHRFLNEMLRDDPRPVGFERYISLGLVVAGFALWYYLRRAPLTARHLTPIKA